MHCFYQNVLLFLYCEAVELGYFGRAQHVACKLSKQNVLVG